MNNSFHDINTKTSICLYFRNNSVRVTLFGERAIEMFNYLVDGSQNKVVALQLARICSYRGISN